MAVQYERFVRSRLTDSEQVDVARVDAIAAALREDLDARSADLSEAHVFGAQIMVIQRIVDERKPFVRVVHRFQSFFGDPRREVDVASCHVFGYGGTQMWTAAPSALQEPPNGPE